MKVLCVDGGGVRGLIPATLLSYLEHDLGRSAHELFDLLVGTSTGGILSLGLCHPSGLSAHNLVDLYVQNAEIIFDPKGTGTSLFSPKYDGEGLRNVLERYFGTATLGSSTQSVCVTSFDLGSMRPKLFSSYGTPETTFVDAALATSAGPTFFPAEAGRFVDGGLVANNPSLVGLAESFRLGMPGPEHFSLDTCRALSLGTGRFDPSLTNLAGAGELAWASHITDCTIDGVAERDAAIGGVLLGERYLRVQPMLDDAMSPFDNVSQLNIAKLQALASQVWSDKGQEIKEFLK